MWLPLASTLLVLLAPLSTGAASFCTPFDKSVVFTNATYTTAGMLLDATGVNQTLSNLPALSTLFAPTNAAFEAYNNGSNITTAEGARSPLLLAGAQLLVVPGQYYSALRYFQTGQQLPTLYPKNNLTVRVDQVNGTNQYTIQSPASAGRIIAGPFFACNLAIYGVDGPFVPNQNLQNTEVPGAIHNITNYLITYLVPGGPVIPINAIITAVQENNGTAAVADAFNRAVVKGYIPQLEALLKQAIGVPKGVATLASIANEMAVQAGCNAVLPLIGDLYPAKYSSAASLQLSDAELRSIPQMDPKLASCVGA